MRRSNPASTASSIPTRASSSAATRWLAWRERGFANRFVTMEVHGVTDADARGSEPILHDGELVGRCTSGGYGWRIGKSLALGMVRPELGEIGQELDDHHPRRGPPRDGHRRVALRSGECEAEVVRHASYPPHYRHARACPGIHDLLAWLKNAWMAGTSPAMTEAGSQPASEGTPDGSPDDLDLNTLPDDELVAQMHDDLYDGLAPEIEEGVHILLKRGWTPYDVLTRALVEGMRVVGDDFRDGILFVPEVLLAANAMKAGMAILRPLLAETGAPKIGKMVIGTVKGDIHDIGKNLVCMMMEGAGFEVIDLGINNAVEKYLAAIEEHQPDILGMSALLTTTMPYMKVVIDTLKEKGIRSDYIVLVGGAPLNEAFAQSIGADAYCRDAAIAVETAKALMARRQGSAQRWGASTGANLDRPTSTVGRAGPPALPVVIACGALARELRAIIETERARPA